MLSKLTITNTAEPPVEVVIHEDSNTSRRLLSKVTGLAGISSPRESKRVRPQAHGALNETKYEDGRLITMDGEVWSTVSIENALEEMRALNEVFLESLEANQPGLLMKWTEGVSGLKLQRYVKLMSDIEPPYEEAMAHLAYHAQFLAEDPRAYSQTVTEATGGTISGGAEAAEDEYVKAVRGLSALAIDGTYIYYGYYKSGVWSIGRVKLNGTGNEPEWLKGIGGEPVALAVNSEYIYWVTGTEHISRAKIGGTGVENSWVTVGTQKLVSIAINTEHIYAGAEFGNDVISRCTLAGGAVEPEWLNSASQARGIALSASYIYWTTGAKGSIGRATLVGANIEPEWIKNANEPIGIAVNSAHVYWTNSSGNTIGRATVSGTEVNQTFVSAVGAGPMQLAANSEYLYWYSEGTGYVGRGVITGTAVGGSITVSQAGNRPTPMVFRIHGPCKNPSIVRTSDGSRIALIGEIGSGNYVEVNTAERTLKLNGLSNVLSMIGAQGTNWPAFEAPVHPQSVTYELAASWATAAYMEALYRSAYA